MTDPIWTTIDEALKRLKPARNWAWLAAKLDTTDQTVNNWSRRKVPAGRYADIAKALGWTVEDLLAGGPVGAPDPETHDRFRLSLSSDGAIETDHFVSLALARLAASLANKSPEQREAIKPSVVRIVDNPTDPAPSVKIARLVMEEPELALHPQAAQADANSSFDIWATAKRMAINWPDAAERSAIARFVLEVEQVERDKSPLAVRAQGARGTVVR